MVLDFHQMKQHSMSPRPQPDGCGPIPSPRPGQIDQNERPIMMAQLPDYHMFDSLAVDAEGNICVATLITGGITIHSPDGADAHIIPMPDVLTTNICFGGEEPKNRIHHTCPRPENWFPVIGKHPGLALNFLNK